jgi:hypothetical protein
MSNTTEVQAALDAARAAAEAGDMATAGGRLREAAQLQERALGPLHPELAETLNNLAIVSERQGDTAGAERCYRRAAEIAAVALPASHPFVTTSRDNLRAFCEANGLPVAVPGPQPAPAVPTAMPRPAPPAPRSSMAAPASAAAPQSTPARTSGAARPSTAAQIPAAAQPSNSRTMMIGTALAIVALLAIVVFVLRRPGSEPVSPSGSESLAPAPAQVETPPPAETVPGPPAAVEPPSAPVASPPRAARPAAPAVRAPSSSSAVVEAKLCLSLARRSVEWRCEEPGATVGAGVVYFYTRIRSPRNTTVSHRWYEGDRLRQAVDLEISANPGSGYRTFSQLTMPNGGAGDWRVELRSADGSLLRELRFVVR